ncbi:MAG: DegT/DnrJ/EryC1/StrS family aminotransferase [Planctomycetota bacterium]
MMWRCDLVPQYEAYRDEIAAAISEVLASGRYVLAENSQRFEQEFAQYIGCDHGVGLNSGTDALVYALWCRGIGAGDEVITTPFTAIPTYSAIRSVGATPVFVDIDPHTYLMDVEKIPAAITPRTRAVVAVHLFGNVVDVERIRALVPEETFLLEDCAQSHGAKIRGTRAGALGDAAAFSFYPTKNLGAYGDAGIVLTNDEDLATEMRLRRMYGMVNKDEFVLDGGNSRLDELQAAILRVKLRHLDAMNAARAARADRYAETLPPEVRPQQLGADVEGAYHVYAATCVAQRDALVAHLDSLQIQSNIYYPKGLHQQIPYQELLTSQPLLPHPQLPETERIAGQIVALPFYPEFAFSELDRVASEVSSFYGARPREGRLDAARSFRTPAPRSHNPSLRA